jgi:hypothetical protein
MKQLNKINQWKLIHHNEKFHFCIDICHCIWTYLSLCLFVFIYWWTLFHLYINRIKLWKYKTLKKKNILFITKKGNLIVVIRKWKEKQSTHVQPSVTEINQVFVGSSEQPYHWEIKSFIFKSDEIQKDIEPISIWKQSRTRKNLLPKRSAQKTLQILKVSRDSDMVAGSTVEIPWI